MEDPSDKLSPYAAAMEWVARITAVGLEMVLPGLAGQWVDHRFGTNFFVLLGFGLGLVAGIGHLLVMTGAANRHSNPANRSASHQNRLSQPNKKEGRDDTDG